MKAKKEESIQKIGLAPKQLEPQIPEHVKCPVCDEENKRQLISENYICHYCGAYLRIDAESRIRMVTDPQSFEIWFDQTPTTNPLRQEGYMGKIADCQNKTGLNEAVIVGRASIRKEPVVIGVCDSYFLMGTMGYGVGERITQAVERATELRLPVLLFCCSGGARMQEGIISLMQMAKTAAAIRRHSEAGLLFVTILTDPTYGGVTASFAMLGDVILAEPGAMIGFAGPRVISQTLGRDIPKHVQTAEYLIEHGLIDDIVKREDLRSVLYYLIVTHKNHPTWTNFTDSEEEIFAPTEIAREKEFHSPRLSAWQKVSAIRSLERATARDYIDHIFDYFLELHGDRSFGDDKAIVGGIAMINGQPVTVIAGEKGKTPQDAMVCRRGMVMPEGYRKALRLMKEAEKFNRPIISFINTPGAHCDLEAEARGQGEAIARNLFEMSGLKVPILCIVIGEAGSGGALATAVGNEVWMLENSLYSILSPEGYASILWRDSSRAEEAAEKMKITAQDLKQLRVIERIVPEYGGADDKTLSSISGCLKEKIIHFLKKHDTFSPEQIVDQRYRRFRYF